jgi:hypothetical protein
VIEDEEGWRFTEDFDIGSESSDIPSFHPVKDDTSSASGSSRSVTHKFRRQGRGKSEARYRDHESMKEGEAINELYIRKFEELESSGKLGSLSVNEQPTRIKASEEGAMLNEKILLKFESFVDSNNK